MGLTTQDPYIQKEHTDLYKILKFRVNWANIEQWLAQLVERQSAVREVEGSSPRPDRTYEIWQCTLR